MTVAIRVLGIFLLGASCSIAQAIVVHPDGTGDYPTIQAAISAANTGDIIVLSTGTYTGDGNRDIRFLGKAVTVQCTNPQDPAIVAATIIDCQGGQSSPHRGFIFDSSEGSDSILDGITIINGFTSEMGGGVYCAMLSAPKISRCRIINNRANYGGGIYCNTQLAGTVVIHHCILTNNFAATHGGGIYIDWKTYLTLTHCIVTGNEAVGWGGGIYLDQPYNTTSMVKNCTIAGNRAANGGGLYIYGKSHLIENNILWDNRAGSGPDLYNYVSPGPGSGCITVSYTLLDSAKAYGTKGIVYGPGLINSNPVFAIPGYWDDQGTPDDESDDIWVEGDYHLMSQASRWNPASSAWICDDVTSPCIDAGNPLDVWAEELWPHGKRINIGAYGNTPQASMSLSDAGNIADFDGNDKVDGNDFNLIAAQWQIEAALIQADLDRDGMVNINDLSLFCENWLNPLFNSPEF